MRHSSHRFFYEDYLYPVSLSLQAAKMADEESSSEQKTLIAEEQKNSCVSLRVEETKPIFQVHNFSEQLSDQVVHFQVLKMVDSLILWIGLKPEMSNLSVAACTKFVRVLDLTSRVSYTSSYFIFYEVLFDKPLC